MRAGADAGAAEKERLKRMGEESVGNWEGLALNTVLLLLEGVEEGREAKLSGAGTRLREEYVGRVGVESEL